MIDFLESADERRTVTKSSISQAREHVLSVTNNLGQYFPILWDHLDYIDCDQVKWHQEMVSDSDELAYMYPVSECTYYTDQYVYVDEHGKELRALPHWFGEGFIEVFVDKNTFVNFDDQALGVRNKQTLQNGLHYVEARDNI